MWRPCAARRPATQERPRRSDAGAETRSPRASGSRVDVLDTADAYPGWEQDLRSEHSVILNPKTDKKKQSFHCELCDVPLPSWAQVPDHCKGSQHKSKKKAAREKKPRLGPGTDFVPASKQ